MERLREFGLIVSWVFGWPPLDSIPRLNTARDDSDSILTPEIRAGIRDVCRVDAALHEYAVELYEARLTAMLDDLLGPGRAALDRGDDPSAPLAMADPADFTAAAAALRERGASR
jgi:hypothetical protein